MIPEFCLTEWRQQVPWVEDYQVEQDLIISRALVSLFERPIIKNSLVFRGGTALHKLFIKSAGRYSEDIDLVQIPSQPIGQILDEIRSALNWLGEPKSKLTERSAKVIYRYTSLDNSQRIVQPMLWLNDSRAMRECAILGMGIVKLHDYIIIDDLKDGSLVEVLSEFQELQLPVYLYYQQSRYLQPKIRKFIDFFCE